MARVEKTRKPRSPPQTPLEALMRDHLHALACGTTPSTRCGTAQVHIGFFLQWAKERGIAEPVEVTRPVLERYQRYLFHYRKKNGEPLSFRSQHARLVPVARVVPMDDAAESHPA